MTTDDARARARQRADELLGGACRRPDGAIWFPGLDGDGWDVFQKGLVAFILAADEEAAALRERVAAADARAREAAITADRWGNERDEARRERDAALAAKVEAERRLGEARKLLDAHVSAYDMLLATLSPDLDELPNGDAFIAAWNDQDDAAMATRAFLAAAPLPGDGAETVGANNKETR